ncbi:MAG: hypothetical protein K940chlam3_00291 [Chlamydiae bacterium]|nr:hypothetical protein [Chlamydiota bacterium]
MKRSYHYTECGLSNIYLQNGFRYKETPRGKAVSINNIDGLHTAIGLALVTTKRKLSGEEIRFLRHEMLISQSTLASLLGSTEQTVHRWERGKTNIPKPSEILLRLLYREHVSDQNGKIVKTLRKIANLEEKINDESIHFKDIDGEWQTAV